MTKAKQTPKAIAPQRTKKAIVIEAPSPQTKKHIALSLLGRPEGCSLADMQQALGWQAHSVRGFLSGSVNKMPGLKLVSEKSSDGPRRYRVVSL